MHADADLVNHSLVSNDGRGLKRHAERWQRAQQRHSLVSNDGRGLKRRNRPLLRLSLLHSLVSNDGRGLKLGNLGEGDTGGGHIRSSAMTGVD